LGVSIKNIGISVIGIYKDKRHEIAYLTLKGIELLMQERPSTRTIQAKINYINVDNNLYKSTPFPVRKKIYIKKNLNFLKKNINR
jgi:hypothetical protein